MTWERAFQGIAALLLAGLLSLGGYVASGMATEIKEQKDRTQEIEKRLERTVDRDRLDASLEKLRTDMRGEFADMREEMRTLMRERRRADR